MNITNIDDYFKNNSQVMNQLTEELPVVKKMATGIYESQLKNGTLLIGGNGGSAADAEHFAGEMTCTFKDRNRRPFNAISLTSSASAITAWVNDFEFNTYFARQVEALGRSGDILFLISTGGGDRVSNASMNLVNAADVALRKDIRLYSLVGKTGGELSKISHEFIKVPSFETSIIQEAHIALIHAICLALDSLTLER
jgi:D-sedoheptulose 7-phosphate isomerase